MCGSTLGPRQTKYCSFYCQGISYKETHKGENNPNWKGDKALQISGRYRAEIWFPSKPCEVCGKEKTERHHVDGNPLNNKVSNIKFLCRKCHMIEDGRLDKLISFSKSRKNGKQENSDLL